MRCTECGSEMRFTSEPMKEIYKGEEFTVASIERWVCDKCGNDVMKANEADRLGRELADAYATRKGCDQKGLARPCGDSQTSRVVRNEREGLRESGRSIVSNRKQLGHRNRPADETGRQSDEAHPRRCASEASYAREDGDVVRIYCLQMII